MLYSSSGKLPHSHPRTPGDQTESGANLVRLPLIIFRVIVLTAVWPVSRCRKLISSTARSSFTLGVISAFSLAIRTQLLELQRQADGAMSESGSSIVLVPSTQRKRSEW